MRVELGKEVRVRKGFRPIFTEVSKILKSCGIPCERVWREMVMPKLREQKEEGGPEKEHPDREEEKQQSRGPQTPRETTPVVASQQ